MTWRLVLGVLVMQRRSLVSITMMAGLFSRPSSMPDWLVALGVALVSLIRTPDVYHLTPTRPVSSVPARVTTKGMPSTWAGTSSRLEGAWALLPGVAGQALAWTVAMVGLMLVVQHNMPSPTIWQPFDAAVTDIRFLNTYCTLLMMLLGMCPGLGRRLGELRRLPLSSRGTALLLSLAPAATPLVFWAVLLALHLAASAQPPDALRLGLLTPFIGAASLVDALGTKSGSSTVKLALGAPWLLAFMYGMDGNRALVAEVLQHWSLPIAGLACFAGSWLVNLHTITRSMGTSRAFRFGRMTLPLGAR